MWVSECSPQLLCEVVDRCLLLSGMKVISFTEHYFSPQGYTSLWLLSESHVAVHTFPEHDATHVSVACCNEQKFDNFITYLAQELHEITNV